AARYAPALHDAHPIYAVSTSPALTQTVNPAASSTGLASSPNPSTFGQSVALTATVSPSAATGTVTFKDGSTSLGTGTLSNGTATLTLSTLATGPHSLTAVYGGDANDAVSTSPALTQTVNPVPAPAVSTLTLNPTSFIQSSSTTLQGTFTDDPSVSHTVTINWGDGNTNTISLLAGTLSFSVSHTYVNNGPKPASSMGPKPSYTYTIQTTVTNSSGGSAGRSA